MINDSIQVLKPKYRSFFFFHICYSLELDKLY